MIKILTDHANVVESRCIAYLRSSVMIWMGMAIRTGWMIGFSAAWFAVVPTTILAQDHAPPEVAGQLTQFFGQGHWLIEVRQEITQ